MRAVQDLSFTVEPGRVTGFLGPNGAGKTTTMRVVLGLAEPTSGSATVAGVPYAQLPHPGRTVGAVLESTSFHPARSARDHLRIYAAAAGVTDRRADEVLAMVGLTPVAGQPVKGFSLGMRQRLALATAMLGDPAVLILDEPANGLDPEGIVWLRGFLRHLAHTDGRTVLVSSHVLSEVEQTVDSVVIIAHGHLVHEGTLDELRGERAVGVVVQTPTPETLVEPLRSLGATVTRAGEHGLQVTGASAATVGHAAWEAGVELHGLREEASSLEQVFIEMTEDVPAPVGDAAPSAQPAPGTTA
ncbi:MAG: ATP-binding cassette domain-containing protein [Candidatus Dormibacteraeota bacterium]|uniref:ATP-binding cassette domain-containing protein n=1 Tax=Candidatus Amunia macphersoniae TaxID=3127014 RepID=A0A934NEZ8_9BACT|nr:ATP-binding cassette domain-containing protein [Candidatus Dormibacteraeota bacterium]